MGLLPGFIGHNVSDRKQIEARKAFAHRLGESPDKAFCVELTRDDLQDLTDRWLTDKYEHTAHGGLKGKTPFEVFSAWTGAIRRIEDERVLDIMLAPIVGKDGLSMLLEKAKAKGNEPIEHMVTAGIDHLREIQGKRQGDGA